jgi:hypothetical protein
MIAALIVVLATQPGVAWLLAAGLWIAGIWTALKP